LKNGSKSFLSIADKNDNRADGEAAPAGLPNNQTNERTNDPTTKLTNDPTN